MLDDFKAIGVEIRKISKYNYEDKAFAKISLLLIECNNIMSYDFRIKNEIINSTNSFVNDKTI